MKNSIFIWGLTALALLVMLTVNSIATEYVLNPDNYVYSGDRFYEKPEGGLTPVNSTTTTTTVTERMSLRIHESGSSGASYTSRHFQGGYYDGSQGVGAVMSYGIPSVPMPTQGSAGGILVWDDVPQWMKTTYQAKNLLTMGITQSYLGKMIPAIEVYANDDSFNTTDGEAVWIDQDLAEKTARVGLIIFALNQGDEALAVNAQVIACTGGEQTLPCYFVGNGNIQISIEAGPMYDWHGVSKNSMLVKIRVPNRADLDTDIYLTYLGETDDQWVPGFAKFMNL